MPSKMPNSGACPDDVVRHASHVVVLFLSMECKAGAHTAALRRVLAQDGHDKTREYRSGVWLVARKHVGRDWACKWAWQEETRGVWGRGGWCDRERQGEAKATGGGGRNRVSEGSVATAH